MATPTRPPANAFVAAMRKVYNPIGFSKGYNFVLWFIFAGALMGFVLARFEYLNFYGIFCSSGGAAPGECFYYLSRYHERVGIILHLATVLPAGFLVFFQFVPAIRYKAILFHRINGYVVVVLAVLSVVGALMIARTSFGGTLSTQFLIGFLSIIFVLSLLMSYINIKRLQIEQHRAWMLRAWFYAGTIITLRIIMVSAASIISLIGGYYVARPCDQIASIYGGSQTATLDAFPDCAQYFSGQDLSKHVAVMANFSGSPVQIAAALGANFGAAGWLALAMHAIGVEIYLQLTPAEAQRLRNVSYQRQLEAGMKHPGRAGLTVDRFGDSELWVPQRDLKERCDSQATHSRISPAKDDGPQAARYNTAGDSEESSMSG